MDLLPRSVEEELLEWLQICAEFPGRPRADPHGGELPEVADLVVLVVVLVLVVLDGPSGVDPAPPLLLPAPPALRRLLLLVVEEDDCAAAAEIPRCLLVLVC